ncbi:MAG TPA: CHAT domain-containing protein [Hyphomicrobiaceae bacterium]|nr:CHAT domain-containing protein [Hyphomicrobiaceae bacterium]
MCHKRHAAGRVRAMPVPASGPATGGSVSGATSGNGKTGHASLAEGLILRNVMQFIGTYWLVNDDAASRFAIAFYSEVLEGKPVGEAIRAGRKKLFDSGLCDWVNYLHFGEPGESLRKAVSRPAAAQVAAAATHWTLAGGEDAPDPLAGEGPPQDALGHAESRSALDLPIGRSDAIKVGAWMKANFGGAMATAAQGTPFTVAHLCAIACQETAYFWKDLIGRLPAAELLERCVLDASGDYPGTSRRPFPVNTQAFRARYGDSFTDMLIDEANKTRALRRYGPKAWVYKGYGIFQYDLQHIDRDEAFFRERQWARFEVCLAKAMGELKEKYAATGDVWKAIRAYNGSGPAAEAYARKVAQFFAWCGDTEPHLVA